MWDIELQRKFILRLNAGFLLVYLDYTIRLRRRFNRIKG